MFELATVGVEPKRSNKFPLNYVINGHLKSNNVRVNTAIMELSAQEIFDRAIKYIDEFNADHLKDYSWDKYILRANQKDEYKKQLNSGEPLKFEPGISDNYRGLYLMISKKNEFAPYYGQVKTPKDLEAWLEISPLFVYTGLGG